MSVPFCHKMLALLPPTRSRAGGVTENYTDPDDCRCHGSQCSLWVPEGKHPTGFLVLLSEQYDNAEPTGRGWCADNLRRQPWRDPAKVDDEGAA